METNRGWRGRALLVGSLVGALMGLGVAYILVQRAEKQGGEVQLSPGETVRLGLSLLALMRQVTDLAELED